MGYRRVTGYKWLANGSPFTNQFQTFTRLQPLYMAAAQKPWAFFVCKCHRQVRVTNFGDPPGGIPRRIPLGIPRGIPRGDPPGDPPGDSYQTPTRFTRPMPDTNRPCQIPPDPTTMGVDPLGDPLGDAVWRALGDLLGAPRMTTVPTVPTVPMVPMMTMI